MKQMRIVFCIFFSLSLFHCGTKQQQKEGYLDEAEIAHVCQKKLTDIIVVDVFSPPVASRIYAYCSLAFYEAMRFAVQDSPSIVGQLRGFSAISTPAKDKHYDYRVAAIVAFCETAKKVTFSAVEIETFEQEMLESISQNDDAETLQNSLSLGMNIAEAMAKRIKSDNYKQTRGMERFEVLTNSPARWTPTAPDYADALEPHWSKILPMVLDSAGQCRALPFPGYSVDVKSPFYLEMKEVYNISNSLTKEQETIAIFWDDNPFVSKHIGHVMFQDKKMTPGGHWMAICRTACRKNKVDLVTTARAYALTAIALHDAFIASWDEKYRTLRLRPQTAIQKMIDEQWISYLQTPPFPEYTSGHSTISAAAATVLTTLFGPNFAYTDSTEVEYGLPVRSFLSFDAAAQEASISRVYGGIHFRSGCENGSLQGKAVARILLNKID